MRIGPALTCAPPRARAPKPWYTAHMDGSSWLPIRANDQRAAARYDAQGRLDARVVATPAQSHRAIRIAFEAARLTTLPTRDSPRTYTRKGVRYSVFGEDGVIWVVQVVET